MWSYGALLIELVTGKEPFAGKELLNVAVEVRDGKSTALDQLPADIKCPEWIVALIKKCFAFEPEQRPSFADIVEFLNACKPNHVELDFDVRKKN